LIEVVAEAEVLLFFFLDDAGVRDEWVPPTLYPSPVEEEGVDCPAAM